MNVTLFASGRKIEIKIWMGKTYDILYSWSLYIWKTRLEAYPKEIWVTAKVFFREWAGVRLERRRSTRSTGLLSIWGDVPRWAYSQMYSDEMCSVFVWHGGYSEIWQKQRTVKVILRILLWTAWSQRLGTYHMSINGIMVVAFHQFTHQRLS